MGWRANGAPAMSTGMPRITIATPGFDGRSAR